VTGDADARSSAGPGHDVALGAGLLLAEQEFDAGSLYQLRQVAVAHAAAAGMSESRARDVMVVLHELAANAVRHGAGRGRLRMWHAAGVLRCLVEDDGREQGAGGRPGGARGAAGWESLPGHGLWLARLVADQVSVMSGPDGTSVTVTFLPG